MQNDQKKGKVLSFPDRRKQERGWDLDEMLELAVEAGNSLDVDEPLLVLPDSGDGPSGSPGDGGEGRNSG